MRQKTIYYSDEINDEFSGITRKTKKIPADFKYIYNNVLWKFLSFVIYRLIMTPIAYIYCKLKFGVKIKNKKILKDFKNRGYFLYGNHTQVPGDGYFPSLITFPKRTYVIVNADSVSLKFTKQFMLMIGALPLPDTIAGTRSFIGALEKRIVTAKAVCIYPEAHIWPYYTKIRPYPNTSFLYPIKLNEASFAFTVTYQKRKIRKTPRVVIYLDGPFYPNDELKGKEQKTDLRNRVHEAMVKRSENSNYEYIKYEKR